MNILSFCKTLPAIGRYLQPPCLLAAFFCIGCGGVVFTTVYPSVPVLSGFALFHAYGDSITAGAFLPDPGEQRYVSLIAAYNSLPLTDFALGGDQACDVPTRQIFAAADSPSLATRSLYSLLISTNDVNVKGNGPYEAIFNLCQQASIAWLALPAEYKIPASSPVVTTTGAGSLETGNHWNAWITGAPLASIRFPFHLNAEGPVYVWYRISDGNLGTFTYALDTATLGSLNTGTQPAVRTQNGTTDSLALLRIPAVAAGDHTLVLTQTSGGTSDAGIAAIGLPPAVPTSGMPRVLVGTTPRQKAGTTAVCGKDDLVCQAYIADITANVALFVHDGLDVRLVNSRQYMSGTSTDLSDNIHPNATGHTEIFHAFESMLN